MLAQRVAASHAHEGTAQCIIWAAQAREDVTKVRVFNPMENEILLGLDFCLTFEMSSFK